MGYSAVAVRVLKEMEGARQCEQVVTMSRGGSRVIRRLWVRKG